jgi:LmbE family N-acetylglucosaminyl deacetylase
MRHALTGVLGIVLKSRGRPLQSSGIRSFLVVAPHPDDETFGCGGTLAILSQTGVDVRVLIITDGAASHPGHPSMAPSRLAELRKEETRRSMSILGVPPERLTFLGAADGTMNDLTKEGADALVQSIAATLRESGAAAILLPCRNDGSSEHEAVFRLTQRAVAESGISVRVLEYPVWSWWSPRLLLRCMGSYGRVWRSPLGSMRGTKATAMSAYESQLRPIPPQDTPVLPRGFADAFDNNDEFFFER